MIEDCVKFVSYQNGSIRTPDGKLVAYWIEADGVLHVDGRIVEIHGVDSIEEAMDIVNFYHG